MERPFFSLAKRKLLKPIECKSERRGFRQRVPEHRVRNDYDMGRRCLDLGRLQATSIVTNIRAQKGKKHRPFSWIESWIGRIPAEHGHGSNALRLVPRRNPDGWRPALLRSGVFTITGGRERWLYRVARKHAGGAGEEGFVRQLVEDLPGLTDRSFFRRPNEEIDGHNRTTYPFGQLSHPSVRAVPGGGLRMSSGAERGCFPSSR
jgi:hypothetical protein